MAAPLYNVAPILAGLLAVTMPQGNRRTAYVL
jgi:hypothetical protein